MAELRRNKKRRYWTASPGLRKRVYEKLGGICAYCGGDLRDEEWWEVDHMTPGNTAEIGNLVPCCPTCNRRKSNRTVEEFRAHVKTKSAIWPEYSYGFYLDRVEVSVNG